MATATKQKDQAPALPVFGTDVLFQPRDRKYPAKLVANEKTSKNLEDQEIIRVNWHQKWENPTRVFPDGNPSPKHTTAYLGDANLQGQIVQAAGENSLGDNLRNAFIDLIGCDMLPDNPDANDYVDHWFMVEDVDVNKGRKNQDGTDRKSYYVTMPVEYLGEDFTYDGQVTVIPVKDKDEEEEAGPTADNDALALVAEALAGLDPSDAQFTPKALAKVNGNETLKANSTLVLPNGSTVRGGLARKGEDGISVAVTELIEAGFIFIDDEGLIQVLAEA